MSSPSSIENVVITGVRLSCSDRVLYRIPRARRKKEKWAFTHPNRGTVSNSAGTSRP